MSSDFFFSVAIGRILRGRERIHGAGRQGHQIPALRGVLGLRALAGPPGAPRGPGSGGSSRCPARTPGPPRAARRSAPRCSGAPRWPAASGRAGPGRPGRDAPGRPGPCPPPAGRRAGRRPRGRRTDLLERSVPHAPRRAPALPAPRVDGPVHRDAVDPGGQAGLAAERGDPLREVQEHVLRHVLRQTPIPEDPPRDIEDAPVVSLVQARPGPDVGDRDRPTRAPGPARDPDPARSMRESPSRRSRSQDATTHRARAPCARPVGPYPTASPWERRVRRLAASHPAARRARTPRAPRRC